MIEKYIEISDLLNQMGDPMPHLEKIQKIIQDPDFRCEKKAFPEVLVEVFLNSSYWLAQELFDESYLYRKKDQNLHGMQSLHLKMTDIGSALIDKGFPVEYQSEKYTQKGPAELAGYAKTFAEQCHKRHAFLHGKIAHKKKNIPFQQQKTLA